MSTVKATNIQHLNSTTPNIVLSSDNSVSVGTTIYVPSISVGTSIYVPSINGGPLAGTRNRIINGAFEIDQRNNGASVSLNNSSGYASDRWLSVALGGAGTGTATVQQVNDGPSGSYGLVNSIKYTVTNAKTPTSTDQFYITQLLEGSSVIDFGFSTGATDYITLSFWVKSSLTGTFSGCLRYNNSGASTYRSYVFNYTINSANTWQYVTVTAPVDSAITIPIDNSVAFTVLFDLGTGSTYQTATTNSWQTGNFVKSNSSINLISTLNATFQLSGVQLEQGQVATPFERRFYQQELALCQRYYEVVGLYWIGNTTASTTYGAGSTFSVSKRTVPTMASLSQAGTANGAMGTRTPSTSNNYNYYATATATLTQAASGFNDIYSASAEL